jgi:hypothetical protein
MPDNKNGSLLEQQYGDLRDALDRVNFARRFSVAAGGSVPCCRGRRWMASV